MVPVKAGDILAGKYRVEDVLGRGGMGVVVAATHLQLGQRVALKFLLPDALESEDGVERFLREARAAVQIRGEHVARVTDVGTLDSGAPYMVMEYLVGSDLASVLRQHGALPVPMAIEYVLQTCEALAEAHALGIVHRDLKPANLFCTQRPDGSPLIKVLDFGISKLLGSRGMAVADRQITSTTTVMGSPLYMSPEQITSSRDVDFRSDIWALGIVLHELLAGQPPYTAESAPALMVNIAVAPPIPLRSHRSDAPGELEAVILRCLQKDKNRRFANVAELAYALVPFAAEKSAGAAAAERVRRVLGLELRVEPVLPLASTATDPRSLTQTGRGQTQSAWGGTGSQLARRARRNWLLGGVGAASVIAAAALAFTAFRSHPDAGVVLGSAPSGAAGAVASHTSSSDAPVIFPIAEAPGQAVTPGGIPPLPSEPSPGRESEPRERVRAPTASKRVIANKPRPAASVSPTSKARPTPSPPPRDLFNDLD